MEARGPLLGADGKLSEGNRIAYLDVFIADSDPAELLELTHHLIGGLTRGVGHLGECRLAQAYFLPRPHTTVGVSCDPQQSGGESAPGRAYQEIVDNLDRNFCRLIGQCCEVVSHLAVVRGNLPKNWKAHFHHNGWFVCSKAKRAGLAREQRTVTKPDSSSHNSRKTQSCRFTGDENANGAVHYSVNPTLRVTSMEDVLITANRHKFRMVEKVCLKIFRLT